MVNCKLKTHYVLFREENLNEKLLSLFICLTIMICATVYASADSTKADFNNEESIESFAQRQREAAEENTNLINYFIENYNNISRSNYEVEDSFPYYYGGSYINASGELVVLVTENGSQSKSNLDVISNIANDPIIESCEYAYTDLNDIMECIMTKLKELRETKSSYSEQVKCWAIDDEENCIYVYLKECNDEVIEWFKREISNSESIVFKVSNDVSEEEVNLSGQGVYRVGPIYFSGAFRVRRSTDDGYKYGFITCAHGNSLESTIYGYDNEYLGTVKLRRYGGAYDVSYVEMNSSDDFSNTITSTPYTLRSTNDDICYPTKGDLVYLYARNNKGSSGTITSTNVSFIDSDGVSFSGLVGSNYQSQAGDSGGLLCTGATDYGCNLYGVHRGVCEEYKVFTSAFKVVNLWYLNRY